MGIWNGDGDGDGVRSSDCHPVHAASKQTSVQLATIFSNCTRCRKSHRMYIFRPLPSGISFLNNKAALNIHRVDFESNSQKINQTKAFATLRFKASA